MITTGKLINITTLSRIFNVCEEGTNFRGCFTKNCHLLQSTETVSVNCFVLKIDHFLSTYICVVIFPMGFHMTAYVNIYKTMENKYK